jgi:hypothetical protein
MVVQKVAIVKNMLVCTICYTFNVAINKAMVVKDTIMQIVATAYILVVDKASTIKVTIMQMGQLIYQIVIHIITYVYNYVHGTNYHKMIKEGERKKKKSLTRRQSLGLHKVFLNCERINATLTL